MKSWWSSKMSLLTIMQKYTTAVERFCIRSNNDIIRKNCKTFNFVSISFAILSNQGQMASFHCHTISFRWPDNTRKAVKKGMDRYLDLRFWPDYLINQIDMQLGAEIQYGTYFFLTSEVMLPRKETIHYMTLTFLITSDASVQGPRDQEEAWTFSLFYFSTDFASFSLFFFFFSLFLFSLYCACIL